MARGGGVGFTTSWDLQRVYRGDRIANMMSNLFVVPLDGSAEPPVNQVALTPPTAPAPAAPAPSPPPVVAIPSPPKVGGGTRTGFFIASKRMLTNAHVVEGCEQVTVAVGQLKGGGRVLARDKVNDLALIETENPGEVVAKLRSGARLGEDVAAFGYPLTSILATSGNFTRGSITATAGLGDDTAHLQMSAPVQSGNSGGPLLDESGNVIGVVDSKLSASETLRLAVRNNEFPQNVNFAIKSSVAQTFLETHGTAFDVGAPGDTFKPADLAAKAQSFSGIIECRP
ncbi:MAG: hypothetical protein DI565_11730 [Ancylobacter novellus]|uniref:Serine protease n=1 Tax=Ancylobacter novellus TaxID=921 RepID=A0A2W5KH46_ANCNO|nr:MAG: hypothetical protein DI565_11730 [Ancylobacter novellus]